MNWRRLKAMSRLFRDNTGSGVRVLCYHTVVESWTNRFVQWPISVTMRAFERHMRYLKQNHEVISATQLPEALSLPARARNRCVMITFDDGYRSNRTLAWPLLKSFGFSALVFVSTGYPGRHRLMPTFILRAAIAHARQRTLTIGGRSWRIEIEDEKNQALHSISSLLRSVNSLGVHHLISEIHATLPEDEWCRLSDMYSSDQLMNWDEIMEMAAGGIAFGAHSHNHICVSACQSLAELEEEIVFPRQIMQSRGLAADYFAYPTGKQRDIGDQAPAMAAQAGYRFAFTTMPGKVKRSTHPYYVPRVPGQIEDMDVFRQVMNRSWVDLVQDRIRRRFNPA